MYVKDSIVEKQIAKDLKIQHLEGRIKETEEYMNLQNKGTPQFSRLQEKLNELKKELNFLLEQE